MQEETKVRLIKKINIIYLGKEDYLHIKSRDSEHYYIVRLKKSLKSELDKTIDILDADENCLKILLNPNSQFKMKSYKDVFLVTNDYLYIRIPTTIGKYTQQAVRDLLKGVIIIYKLRTPYETEFEPASLEFGTRKLFLDIVQP